MFILQTCGDVTSGRMFCQTPHINITDSFANRETSDKETSGAQLTTSPSSTKYPVNQQDDKIPASDEESLNFYIGFKLDGVESYTNLSDSLDMFDYGKIMYYTVQPQINVMTFEKFIPYSGVKISIEVRY